MDSYRSRCACGPAYDRSGIDTLIQNMTPNALIVRVIMYYAVLVALVLALISLVPESLQYLPFGGLDAIDRADIEVTETSLRVPKELLDRRGVRSSPKGIFASSLFLLTTLISTILVMIPVTWAYSATRFDSGPSKNFVRALILMPICATTVVLLIQDSLALAFGLAAMVAAVRFRVSLRETIDGIYIFAAVCVGLAAGIGYLGIALVMAIIFTLATAVMWKVDYGRNPIDDSRQRAAKSKLEKRLDPGP
ncbi:MAG: DUF4956 domain-containing protein [Pseudomonadota bacterium]